MALCPTMKKLMLVLLIIFSSVSAFALETARINPFTSDGCSKWPEGPRGNRNLWRECCFVHDISYWMGGPRAERLRADRDLKACVERKGARFNSLLMYVGVRLGGSPNRRTSYRWGYGWDRLRGYRSLTAEETESVRDELDNFRASAEELEWMTPFRTKRNL